MTTTACFLLFLVFIFVIHTGVNAQIPRLTIQPNSGLKEVGQSLALSCTPSVDDPSLINQMEWKDPRGRRIEAKMSNSLYVQSMSTERGLMLIFSKLQLNQGGNYTCTASYANSEKLQASLLLEPYIAMNFVDAPESQYPRVGEDFLVKCQVEGNPSPVVEWIRNDMPIKNNDRYVIQSDGLVIKNVRETDDGIYKCKATVFKTGHLSERNIKVEVIIPPKIQQLSDVVVIEGETASTKCTASGKPPPSYRWIKLSTSQDLSKTDRFDVKRTTGDLIINRVEFGDDGFYKCVAENQAGRDETTVKINVLVKPRIYELLNVTAPIGVETKLICKAQGRPIPKITFRKRSNKEPFTPGQQLIDKRIIIEQEVFEAKGEAYGTLIITNLTRNDDGLYECMASNTAGNGYKNGHITVEFPPTFERTNVPIYWTWGERPGNITCIPEAIPNATIIWKFGNIEINDSPNFKKIGNSPISHLIVKPLHDPRFYGNYECVAINKHGTASIFLKLNEAKVPEHIVQVKPETITATTIKFNISPPRYWDTLPIRSFTVQYKRERDVSWDYSRNHTWSFNAPYILENLIPETTYHLRFAAANDVGLGPWINIEPITMPRRSEPAEPKIFIPTHNIKIDENDENRPQNNNERQDIIAVSPYADHFELRWNVPNDNGDPIDSYLIRYCVTERINGEWRDSECTENIRQSVDYNSYELNNLRPDTIYKIELRANNAIGSSSPAQIRVKTARGIDPAVPYNQPAMSSTTIIGIVIAAVLLILILVDLTCFCVNRSGIIALICNKARSKKHDDDDPKLGSYKAAPAHPNSLNLPLPVKLAPSPTKDEREPLKPNTIPTVERNMSVEFDGKHVYTKSGEIIGKHSAV